MIYKTICIIFIIPSIVFSQTNTDSLIEKASNIKNIDEITVTGTLKEVVKSDNPVNIQVYQSAFLKKNPASNILENISQVSGLRPQVNCNICGTGDIHINGMEGPYTMVLIDGMPMVSGLSTVYGLMGIPRTLIERMEVMKGPASSLYGSEAMGGIINLITKKTSLHPRWSIDLMSTSLLENTFDMGSAYNLGKNINGLSAIHAHYFNKPIDLNKDYFTDLPIQKRFSLFQKISLKGKNNSYYNFCGRLFMEDRWGGGVNWKPEFRGTDSIYGETIQTTRWEIFGTSRLPFKKNIFIWYSINEHYQKSTYGMNNFDAIQKSYFFQSHHDFSIPQNEFLLGITSRFQYYDDNTVATEISDYSNRINRPYRDFIPGFFFQWEYKPVKSFHALTGFRTDYHPIHGLIPSPRVAFKFNFSREWFVRFNGATGFRVVNLFTEEHASLTGARKVEIRENLNPERSFNITASFTKKIYASWGILEADASILFIFQK
jgi:outer membrane receptor for ferrienterochelin and colicins